MSCFRLEGVQSVLAALNLGLLSEAIFLVECIYLGNEQIFRLFYKISNFLKPSSTTQPSNWDVDEVIAALQALVLLNEESDPTSDHQNIQIYIQTLSKSSKSEFYSNPNEFAAQLLSLLTKHFKPNYTCHGIHSIIDKFNILRDEIVNLDLSSLLSSEDRYGPFAGSYALDLELGKAFLNISQYKRSRFSFERAFRTNPYSNRCYDLYSTVLWHLNEKDLLFTLSLKSKQYWPSMPETCVVQGNYFSCIMANEKAIECFRKAQELNENYGYSYFLEGYDWLSLNNLDEAEKSFSRLRKIEPDNFMPYFGLGIVNFKKGFADLALKYLHFASTKNPVHINVKCYTSLVYDSLGDKEAALQALLQIDSKTSFSSPVLAYQLSKLYHSLNMPMKEEFVLKQALQNFPNDAALYFSLAGIKRDQDDIPAAVQLLKRAYELDLSNPLAKEHINSIGI